MTTFVDERGRILIPKEIRDRLGLEPGMPVNIGVEEGSLTIRPGIPRREALQRLVGVIPRSAGPPPFDALDVKRMWEHHP